MKRPGKRLKNIGVFLQDATGSHVKTSIKGLSLVGINLNLRSEYTILHRAIGTQIHPFTDPLIFHMLPGHSFSFINNIYLNIVIQNLMIPQED